MFVPSEFGVHSHTKAHAIKCQWDRLVLHPWYRLLVTDFVACCIGDGNNVRFLHIKFHAPRLAPLN